MSPSGAPKERQELVRLMSANVIVSGIEALTLTAVGMKTGAGHLLFLFGWNPKLVCTITAWRFANALRLGNILPECIQTTGNL